MPLPSGFTNKKQYAEYMRKYRKFKKKQMERLERAIRKGNTKLARQILNAKPSIPIYGNSQPRHSRRKGKKAQKK